MVIPWCFASQDNAHRNNVEILLSVHLLYRTRTTAIYSDMLRLVRRLLLSNISNWRLLYWLCKLFFCLGLTSYTNGEITRGRSFLLHTLQVKHVFQHLVGMNYWWWFLVVSARSRIVFCVPLLSLFSKLPKKFLRARRSLLGVVRVWVLPADISTLLVLLFRVHVLKPTVTYNRRTTLGTSWTVTHIGTLPLLFSLFRSCVLAWAHPSCREFQRCWHRAPAELRGVVAGVWVWTWGRVPLTFLARTPRSRNFCFSVFAFSVRMRRTLCLVCFVAKEATVGVEIPWEYHCHGNAYEKH